MNLDACLWAAAVPLEPGPKLVLLTLAVHANAKLEAWPTLPRLARETGFSDRQVRRHLRGLESEGLILGVYRHGHSTVWVVNTPIGGRTPMSVTPDMGVMTPRTPMSARSKKRSKQEGRARSSNGHPVASDSFAEDTFLKGTGWVRDTRRRRRPRSGGVDKRGHSDG